MRGDVWFVYDGECPLCRVAAQALRIRQSVGNLHLVDARTERDHPLMARINAAGLEDLPTISASVMHVLWVRAFIT